MNGRSQFGFDTPNPARLYFLTQPNRVIILDHMTDSAVVFFLKGQLDLPDVPIALLPMGKPLSIGLDLGWLGYPAIEPFTMCFFSGSVSAHLPARNAYLIDGVAINGVSGGPVFHCSDSGEVQIIGSVSAYHANRVTGETLPGLLKAQDVSHFHGVAKSIRDLDEANAKKKEFEAAQQQQKDEQQSGAVAPQEKKRRRRALDIDAPQPGAGPESN